MSGHRKQTTTFRFLALTLAQLDELGGREIEQFTNEARGARNTTSTRYLRKTDSAARRS